MEGKYTIVTATDLHYLAPELTRRGEAFDRLMEFSYGRLTEYSEELLQAFAGEMCELCPDAVLLTGDVTFNGERISHERIAAGLSALKTFGIPVFVLPGNHDLNNLLAGAYLGEEAESAESVNRAEFASVYREFDQSGKGQILARDPKSFSVLYALEKDLWLLLIDVNGNGVPGEFTDENMQWVKAQLELAFVRGAYVIGASHQNLLSHNKIIADGYMMLGADNLFSLYQKYGVALHLSGHMHIQHISKMRGVTEIVTSALSLSPCQYGVLTVEGDEVVYETRSLSVEKWAMRAGKSAEPLTYFSQYAEEYLKGAIKKGIMMELAETAVSKWRREQLADGMAEMNRAYFSGTLNRWSKREKVRSQWKKYVPESFWNQYTDSIFSEGIKDENRVRIVLSEKS